MPRFVKPFYLEGQVDGIKTPIKVGPKSSGGGFHLNIFQRDSGGVLHVLRLEGINGDDGLTLYVVDEVSGKTILEVHTDY